VKKAVATAAGLAVGMRIIPAVLPQRDQGGSSKPGKSGARQPALLWLRSDLRLHDHEALVAANSGASSLVPVYCFDPREYGKSAATGFDRTGPARARFILDSVADLRGALRARGSDLVLAVGRPEEVLPRLAAQAGASAVYCHQEVAEAEARVESAVRAALQRGGVSLRSAWGGSTLFHLDDLPFRPASMPASYKDFHEALGRVAVRRPLEAPRAIKGLPLAAGIDVGQIPTMAQLGFSPSEQQQQQQQAARGGPGPALGAGLRGGESEALRHLTAFVAHVRQVAQQQQQQQQGGKGGSRGKPGARAAGPSPQASLGPQFSCKISPWLAMGCLSPRKMYAELRAQAGGAAVKGGVAGSSNWLVFELLWRDFFRFITTKNAAAPAKSGTPRTTPAPVATPALAAA